MRRSASATLTAAVLLTAGLAGCIGESGSDVDLTQLQQQGLSVEVSPKQGDASTNFTFDATGTPGADDLTFTWAFGDGENATGDVVHHTFRWTNNLYKVEVTAHAGNRTITSTVEVPVGTGENAKPTVDADRDKPWVAHGEPLTLTAKTDDPDGDPVNVTWLITKKQEQGGHHGGDGGGHDHGHGGGGHDAPQGSDYGIPRPTGKTGSPVTFTFTESGTYRLIALAEDPKGGKATDPLEVKVTRTVPKPTFTLIETGNLTAGTASGQTGLSASELIYETQQPSQNTYIDAARYDLRLVYPGHGNLSLNWSGTAGAGPADLDLFLQDSTGENIVAKKGVDPTQTTISVPVDLNKGSYTILVRANAGAQIPYEVTLDLDLEIPGLTVDVHDETGDQGSDDEDGHDDHDH